MIEVFDESGIGKAPAIFDPAKLRYINAEYIRAMSEEAFFEKAEPYIDSVVKTPCNKALLAQVLHQRCELMSDIPEQIDFIDEMPEYDLAMYTNKKMKTTAETAKEALEAILPVLEAIPADGFTRDAVHAALFALIEEKGVKNGFMLWPLRVAVSGKQFTPGGRHRAGRCAGQGKSGRPCQSRHPAPVKAISLSHRQNGDNCKKLPNLTSPRHEETKSSAGDFIIVGTLP